MDHSGIEKRKTNPRETANILSVITFAYTGSLFKKAFKNDLEEEDLYAVLTQCGSKRCGDKMERQWLRKRKEDPQQPVSLLRLMWCRYGWRYLAIGMIQLAWKIFQNMVEPWAISNLISYFTPGQMTISRYDAYLYAVSVIGVYFFGCIYLHNYILMVVQLGIEIKTSFSSILYRKALRLTPSAISDITLGNIVTLITKDVHVFQQSVWIVNDTWIGIVQLFVICYLLYRNIGPLCFVGVAILISAMPLQIFIGRYISKLRLMVGKKTDERLQVTQETLSAIRIIKMYTWEAFFGNKITAARAIEMAKMLFVFYLRVIIVVLGVTFSKVGLYALVMAYVWSGGVVNPKTIFYILSMFRELRQTVGVYIPFGFGRAAEFYSAMTRINRVINGEELKPKTGSDEPTSKPVVEINDAVVHIKDMEILRNVSFRVDSGLTLVTGTVGSGKTSFLKALLQDYPLTSGSVVSHGRISYASQDPWLFPSSIRQNITFGQPHDEKRYQDVIRVCALQYDFSLFDKGDQTIVTDKGLNLSKGQQARVNLARAIYKESEIYLLDDSLTALDAHVQDYIFNECIKKYLSDKICILVSQTASHIRDADNVVIMDKGQIRSFGKPDDKLIEEVNELVVEDDDLEKEVVEENKEKNEEETKDSETDKLLETEQTTKRKVYSEVKKKGKVDISTYKKYCLFGGGILLISFNAFLCGVAQVSESYSDQLLTKWVDQQHEVLVLRTNMSDLPMERSIPNITESKLNKRNILLGTSNGIELTEPYTTTISDMINYSHIDVVSNVSAIELSNNMTNYSTEEPTPRLSIVPNVTEKSTTSLVSKILDYSTEGTEITTNATKGSTISTEMITNMNHSVEEATTTFKTSVVTVLEFNNTSSPPNLSNLSSIISSDVYSSTTVDQISSTTLLNTSEFSSTNSSKNLNSTEPLNVLLNKAIENEQSTIRRYSIMIIVSSTLVLIKTYANFDYCRRASVRIHKAMVNSAMNAIMSFYDTHFIGNVLNRFSQDLNNIDEVLPFVFGEIFRVTFSVCGIIFLIATVNVQFLGHAVVFLVIIYILRLLYLPAGRSLKRLEAATRSPMIGHLNASLEGLTTIRAYKAQPILIDEFDRHQDLYTSAHYTSICSSRAFGIFIDFFCTALIASLVLRFLFIEKDTTAGNVGLALTQILMLAGHVQWGVRQWAELENLMTSVERLLEYTEIKSEKKEGVEVEDWPIKGAVKYENVFLTYNNSEVVLKNLNFSVEPGQVIGIVGRTGAGKSSIISTMFRLYDVEGKILIDGVNTKSVSLKYLRQKIGIIPQDPVLFSGTIRTNLDPFGEFKDDVLWKALDKVGLNKLVTSLDMSIKASGSNFSSGQKQLVCLARAILRKVKIIILDEATANMDHETDVLLNRTVKDNFADCTIFVIAHRLHSILECDKVMVLDRGEIREFDKPVLLLETKGGMFYKMVEQAGLLDYLS